MNNRRRSRLKDVSKYLSMSQDIIDSIADEEQDAMDNVPENLQYTERYEDMSDCVDDLESISNDIGEVLDKISSFSYWHLSFNVVFLIKR